MRAHYGAGPADAGPSRLAGGFSREIAQQGGQTDAAPGRGLSRRTGRMASQVILEARGAAGRRDA